MLPNRHRTGTHLLGWESDVPARQPRERQRIAEGRSTSKVTSEAFLRPELMTYSLTSKLVIDLIFDTLPDLLGRHVRVFHQLLDQLCPN
jgi:hypothetical protein